jgi:hypothetical protein
VPAGEALGENEFEGGGDRDGSELRGAKLDAGDGGDADIAGADAGGGGGKDKTGAKGAETLEQGHGVWSADGAPFTDSKRAGA